MPLTITNANLTLTTSQTQVYICPAGKTAIVTLLQATNKTALADKVTIHWYNAANTQVTNLLFETSVPANSAISAVAGKLTLKAGDIIRGLCSVHNAVDVTVSVLEVS